MPIEYTIDHAKRLVLARGSGILTDKAFFEYHHEVWSMPAVAGYDELVDVSLVTEIQMPSSERVRDLAMFATVTDPPHGKSKLAIVAPQDYTYGLGRMYEAHRGFQPGGTKEVSVFRTMQEALDYLGIK